MNEREIFTAALDKPVAERSAFLDDACAGDRSLRERVEVLLKSHDDAGSFLETPPAEFLPTIAVNLDPADEDAGEIPLDFLQPSDKPRCIGTLADYEVVEVVGRGGMGLVLKAHDPKLNRVVAIKVLAPEMMAMPTAVKRFVREARSAAAVSHDHVVTIHAIDEDHRPPFLAMEFVGGKSLQEKIDSQGPIDVKEILRIGMQTAAGLAAAHKQGLVHRDIKPANILLENGIERVKLTDFGLARAVDDIGVTRTGQIAGTPQYMSPEQAQGQRVDHRTDLFSLGCVLYAMCTGHAAFRADSAVAVMHRVVHDAPRPIRELNEDIPGRLCNIVDKLLEKDVDDRFESAEEVEDLFGRYLAHLQQPGSVPPPESIRPSSARLPRKADRRLSWLRRVPIPAWLALLLFGMVFVAGFAEWTGQPAAATRGNGVLFYLFGTGFVLAWAACSFATRIVRGRDANAASVPPTWKQLTGFFTAVILLTGAFIWQWAQLSNKSDREMLLGFFFGHGSIVLELPSPDIEVEFNGKAIGVPVDGVVVLQCDQPGSYVHTVHRTDGTQGHGEFLIGASKFAIIKSGVFTNAKRVVVAGPIRGNIDKLRVEQNDRADKTKRERKKPLVPSFVEFAATWWEDDAERLPVLCLDTSPDGKWVVSGHRGTHVGDGEVRLCEVWDDDKDGKKPFVYGVPVPKGVHVWDVAFSPDGKQFAWVQGDGVVGVAPTNNLAATEAFRFEKVERATGALDYRPLRCVCWSPRGKMILAGSSKAIYIWDVEKRAMPIFSSIASPGNGMVNDVAYSPDGTQIAAGSEDGTVTIFRTDRNPPLPLHVLNRRNQSPPHKGPVHAVAFSPDSSLLYSAGEDGVVLGWDAKKGRWESAGSQDIGRAKRALAFSPDGSLISQAGDNLQIIIGEAKKDGGVVKAMLGGGRFSDDMHKNDITSLAFTPDGRYMLSGSEDGTIKWWEFAKPVPSVVTESEQE